MNQPLNNKYSISAIKTMREMREKKSKYWEKLGRSRSLELFHQVAERVPAYKDFLRKNKVQPSKIKTWSDFEQVPIINKKNYLTQYSLEQLCWGGHLKNPLVFTSTSGSTGDPFYFPRGEKLDWQYSVILEQFLTDNYKKNSGPVLVLICFGMGVWIGGMITYEAFAMASRRSGLSVSILTPGINKMEILKALKKLSPKFKQTVIVGYPPIVKDIVDEALAQKINLKELGIRFVFAAEVFTEKFRDYLASKVKVKNIFLDYLHIYGSADLGAMAWETSVSVLIKRLAQKNRKIGEVVYSISNKTPTLAQFNPEFVHFESQNGELFLTGDNALPLVRYSIGDRGGVLSYGEMDNRLWTAGIKIVQEIHKNNLSHYACQLPFVYVYERLDFSTTLYGVQIYPEAIREALIRPPSRGLLTGKFTLFTKFDRKQNQYLEINIEIQKGKKVPAFLKKVIVEKIFSMLKEKSSEFKELSKHINKRAVPRAIFWSAESLPYFKPGIKQKWAGK